MDNRTEKVVEGMSDFETHPVGTAKEIERLEARELEQSCQIERRLERERYLEWRIAKLQAKVEALREALVLSDRMLLEYENEQESDDGI